LKEAQTGLKNTFRTKPWTEVAIHDEIKLKITGNKRKKSYITSRTFMRVKVVSEAFICEVGSDG
jgi:hypothetical protein